MNWENKGRVFLLFFAVVFISMLVLIFINVFPIRLFFGISQVIILPGYLLINSLFPNKDKLNTFWRWSLVIPVSIALVSSVLLIFNYFFVYNYIKVIFVISIMNVIFLFGSLVRYQDSKARETAISRCRLLVTNLLKYKITTPQIILITTIFFFLGSVFFAFTFPQKNSSFTEFYVFSNEKRLPYTVPLLPNNTLAFTLGITNNEGKDAVYWVEVDIGTKLIYKSEKMTLTKGTNQEKDFLITVPSSINSNEVNIFLGINNKPFPYRSLKFYLAGDPVR